MPALPAQLSLRGRLLAPALYLVASALLVALLGVPYQRDLLAVWLIVGMLCFSLSDVRGAVRGVLVEWLPFVIILVAYDSLRGSAGHLFAPHFLPQLQVDQWLFGGTAPTVTLQHWLWHGSLQWYDLIFWGVYLTHFLATPLLAAVLWKVDRVRFRLFAMYTVTLSFAGLLTYALYPAAPPWMAAQHGLMEPITRVIPAVWHGLGLHSAGSFVESGYRYVNDVAAVPSLHAAFALLVAITLWPRRHEWLRPLVASYPLVMAFTLVYTGEHYVFDVLLGWLYTLVSVALGRWLLQWWRRRSESEEPLPVRGPAYGEAAG